MLSFAVGIVLQLPFVLMRDLLLIALLWWRCAEVDFGVYCCCCLQAANMLLAALPNYAGQPLVPPSKDPVQFVQQLHSHILAAVLPLWSHPKAAHAPAGVLTAMIRVLQTCAAGPSHASLVLRYQQQGRPVQRVAPQPDAAMVTTITEMGFSQARAEEALRRVGANSVELAMEWLISHPEEPAAPAAAAGAAAGGAAAGAAAAGAAAAVVDEEEELTRALLASLSVVGMSPDTVAQRSQQQQQQQQQEQEQEEQSRPPTPAADAADGSPTAAQEPTSAEQVTTPQATQRPLVQPGAPIARAAAAPAAAGVPNSSQPADTAGSAATGIPAPAQLVDGAVRLVAASPSTAFCIADLLLTSAQREEGKGREALVGRLMDACLPPAPAADPAAATSSSAAAAAAARTPSGDILTPARLLLLLLTKDGSSRKVAAKLGLVPRCLLQLEQWQSSYRAAVEAFERSAAQQGQAADAAAAAAKQLEVPVWVEASLMLLDVMVTTTLRTTNPATTAAARVAAARAAVAAAAEPVPRPAAAAAAPAPEAAADAGAAAAAGGDVQMADQPGGAAAEGSPAAADAAAAAPAAEDASTPQTTPRPVVQPGAPTLGVAPAAAAVGTAVPDTPVAGAAGDAAADAPGVKLPAELSQLSGLSSVLANWRPCGLLDEQQQRTATSLCLALLQQLHDHADKWEAPATSMFEADGSLPNPSSVTQALLQLLAHLTKRHSNAQQVRHSCTPGLA
jgi:hypothetical protein